MIYPYNFRIYADLAMIVKKVKKKKKKNAS